MKFEKRLLVYCTYMKPRTNSSFSVCLYYFLAKNSPDYVLGYYSIIEIGQLFNQTKIMFQIWNYNTNSTTLENNIGAPKIRNFCAAIQLFILPLLR